MTVIARSIPRDGMKRRGMAAVTLLAALAGAATLAAQEVQARGPGGSGGFRGGGAGISRGGGGLGARSGGIQRPSRAKQRPNAAGGQRPGNAQGKLGQGNRTGNTGIAGNGNGNGNGSGNARATGNGNTRTAANGNTGVAGSGNGSGNTGSGNMNNGNVGSGNGNTGVVNNGNVVAGNDVDIDVNNGAGGYYGTGAAYATGVAVGATTSAAVVGSYYATLPAGCAPYYYGAYRYYSCGSSWYQQQVKGSSTVYVVVSDPTKK